jgi:hypothetical protein
MASRDMTATHSKTPPWCSRRVCFEILGTRWDWHDVAFHYPRWTIALRGIISNAYNSFKIMRTNGNAPYHRLTLGKPPSRFRLAAHPTQIAVRLRVWVHPRPGKAWAPIAMRSEIVSRIHPNQAPGTRQARGLHSRLPRARPHADPTSVHTVPRSHEAASTGPRSSSHPIAYARVQPEVPHLPLLVATPRVRLRPWAWHGSAPRLRAVARVRSCPGESDLPFLLCSFLVDCIGITLLLQLVFLRRGSVLRGRRGCKL